jgi:hypothetical protein
MLSKLAHAAEILSAVTHALRHTTRPDKSSRHSCKLQECEV